VASESRWSEVLFVVVIVGDVELVDEGEDGAFVFHAADDIRDISDLACAKKAVRTVLEEGSVGTGGTMGRGLRDMTRR